MHRAIFITCPSKKEARTIARELIKRKLAACVNIIDRVESLFWWQGNVDSAKEVLLMVKSKKALFPRIVRAVKSKHSYDVPEIIAVPIVDGFAPYLRWIDESVRHTT